MKIPSTLRIGGHDYTVNQNPACAINGSVCCGAHNGSRELIEVNPSFPIGTQESTLLHEIIESINWMHELKLEHRVICTLEEGLYQVLKDNDLYFGRNSIAIINLDQRKEREDNG